MRLRTLLATTVAGTLLLGAAGLSGGPAQASRAPSPALAGSVVAWGNTDIPLAADAIEVPADLTAPVADIATSMWATAAVTTDGHLRVWGSGVEVEDAPTDVTDAVAVSVIADRGAVLHADGRITAWGDPDFKNVPSDLRAKAIAIDPAGTGYAVKTDGTLATWGAEAFPMPASGLTNLVDVASTATGLFVMALRADGTVIAWSPNPADPLATLPDLGGRKVTQIVAGSGAYGLVLDDGTIRVWGAEDSVPANQPDFAGKKVISLALGYLYANPIAGAVTEDGVVHTWGADGAVQTHPAQLAGQPVTDIALGFQHAAVVVTSLQEVTKPMIAGTAQVGQSLTATPATFNVPTDAPATGQWYADAAPITGQTGTTLVLDKSVVGKKISYRSTGTRSGKTVTSASTELGPVTEAPKPPITKAKSTVTAKAKATGKTKKVAKKVTITITVKTTKGVSPAGKVTVTLKGKTKKKVTATVNAKGKATVTVKKVKRGKYQAQVSYAGNAKVASSKKAIKFKV